MFKNLLLTTICFCIFFSLAEGVAAQSRVSIVSREDAGVDTSIIREDINYNLPSNILITPVFLPNDDLSLSSTDHYRGVYFYTTDILGFNDVPFHYLVGEDGLIFQGNEGEAERRIKIDGVGDNMVVIGYLTDQFETNFSSKGKSALNELALKVANENSIDATNIEISGVKFVRNQTTRSVSMVSEDLFGIWNTELSDIRSYVKENYRPIPKTYDVEVNSIAGPESAATPGQIITLSVNLTNKSKNGLYGNTDTQLLLAKKDSGTSAFFINNEWVSTSEVPIMTEEQILLPFEEGEFEFKVKVPLFPGTFSEDFELKTIGGQVVEGSDVKIELEIGSTNEDIVQITGAGLGTIIVREQPAASAAQVSQVSDGERYFLIETTNNGWAQIELSNGLTGWIPVWNVSDI